MNDRYIPSHYKVTAQYQMERNRDIYIDRLYNGMMYKDLSIKYGLSRNRCRQIYEKHKWLVDKGVIEE